MTTTGLSTTGRAVGRRLLADPAARLDPRTLILAATALVVTVTTLDSLVVLGLCVLGAFALTAVQGLRLTALAHRLVHVEAFAIILLVLLPLTVPGTPILQAGPLTASAEGLTLAATLALRIVTCVILLFALLHRLEPVHLATALKRLHVPPKLVQMVLLVIRYAAVFRGETHRLSNAMRARGLGRGISLQSLRSYGNLAGMVLVRALERAERVDAAMRCRGFRGQLPISENTAFGRADAITAGLVVSVIVLVVLGDHVFGL